jgi:large subunit ribosomal protein L7/L12
MERSAKTTDILTSLKGMTILEVNDLVKAIEEEFGISAAMPMMAMAAGPGAGAAAPAAEEKTEFDVVLQAAGDKKIQVIKVLRTITGLGLKEAKDLVDGAPKTVKEKVSRAEADKIKAEMEEQGATIEIK